MIRRYPSLLLAIALAAAPVVARACPHQRDANSELEMRIERLAAAIERRLSNGSLPAGRATFMMQDLQRVSTEIDRIVAVQGTLKPGEVTSCRLMLDRVARRLQQP